MADRFLTFPVTVRVGDDPRDVPMTFIYAENDPYAVGLVVTPDGANTWHMARQLLLDAIAYIPHKSEPATDIIVRRIGAKGERTEFILHPNNNLRARLTMSTDDVREFAQYTRALVNVGQESGLIDWAAEEQALGLAPGQLNST